MDITRRHTLGLLASLLGSNAAPQMLQKVLAAAAPAGPTLESILKSTHILIAHWTGMNGRMGSDGKRKVSWAQAVLNEFSQIGFTPESATAFLAGEKSEIGFQGINTLSAFLRSAYSQLSWGEVLDSEGAKAVDKQFSDFMSGLSFEDLMRAWGKALGLDGPIAVSRENVIMPSEVSPEYRARETQAKDDYYQAIKELGRFVAEADPHAPVSATLKKIAQSKLGFVKHLLDHPEQASRLHDNPWSLKFELDVEPDLAGTDELHAVLKRLEPHIKGLEDAQGAQPEVGDDDFERGLYDALRDAHEAYGHRLFADVHIPPALAEMLKKSRFDVRHALDLFVRSTPDEDLARYAIENQRTIITQDEDFLQENRFPLWKMHGVIVLPHAEEGTAMMGCALIRAAINDVVARAPRAPCGWIGRGLHYRRDGILEMHELRPGSAKTGARRIILRPYFPVPQA